MPMSAKGIISIVFASCFCFAATSGATAQEFSATSEALVQELLRKPTSLTLGVGNIKRILRKPATWGIGATNIEHSRDG